MKQGFLLLLTSLSLMLLVSACTPEAQSANNNTGVMNDEHMVEDEHMHSPEEHMAGAHGVPEEAAAVSNPITADEASISIGADAFATNCAVCHGEQGLGDGPTAESLETKPADLTAGHVQGLSDGALFYIISHGKPDTPMPAWEDVLEEGARWNVVNFLRTLDDHEDDHMEDDHAGDEHMDGDEHGEGEHMEDEHMEGDEHGEDEHMEDEHPEDNHMEGDEHPEDEHMENEHSDGNDG